MGTALLKIKLMPTGTDTDLEKLKSDSQALLDSHSAKNANFEEQPVAFGLKALIVGFGIDESQDLDPIEDGLRALDGVNSAEVIDMRRALE